MDAAMIIIAWKFAQPLRAALATVIMIAATPVSAAMVHFDPADITVSNQSGVTLDLNADGTNDLSFSHTTSFLTLVLEDASAIATGINGSGIVGSGGEIALLNAGALIGPFSTVSSGSGGDFARYNDNLLNLFGSATSDGQWWNNGDGVSNGYIGFLLNAVDGAHFGWARLSVADYTSNDPDSLSITIHEYAYEDVAGAAVLVGSIGSGPVDDEVPVPAALWLIGFGLMGVRRATCK